MDIKKPSYKNSFKGNFNNRILLICYFDTHGVPSVPEIIHYMQECLNFSVEVLNLFNDRYPDINFSINPNINLLDFDILLIHNSVSYDINNLNSLDKYLDTKIADFRGLKILFRQDDHFKYLQFIEYIKSTKFDLIYTVVPRETVPKVYSKNKIGGAEVISCLTTYVTPSLLAQKHYLHKPYSSREIDIGYRGSIYPLHWGSLGYEKRIIGDLVQEKLKNKKINIDVSSLEKDRLGGDNWFEFLSNCKSVLGVEGGCSIFISTPSEEKRIQNLISLMGKDDNSKEYAQKYLNELKDLEDQTYFKMISPRMFEAIAMRTTQILFPGKYSNILKPNKHYFPLKKDLSNLEQAIDLINDPIKSKRMNECAYEEVLENPKYSIFSFIQEMNVKIEETLKNKNMIKSLKNKETSKHKNLVMLHAHSHGIDIVRDKWLMECHKLKDIKIHQFNVSREIKIGGAYHHRKNSLGGSILSLKLKKWEPGCLDFLFSELRHSDSLEIYNLLKVFEDGLYASPERLRLMYNLPNNPQLSRVNDFKWYLAYLLDTTFTLFYELMITRGVSSVLAINLPTLLAASLYKQLTGVKIIYHSFEYWPDADNFASTSETQFWEQLEGRLLKYTDFNSAVSEKMAEFMTEKYGYDFFSMPNASPLEKKILSIKLPNQKTDIVKFLYIGNYSDYRGLEILIENWVDTPEKSHLYLRGPLSSNKRKFIDLAKDKKLLNERIFFIDPVNYEDLISKGMRGFHVGVIPYPPHCINHKYACPNKLGQLMAAGLPILTNNMVNTSYHISRANCGLCCSFQNRQMFISKIKKFMSISEREIFSRNSKNYYKEYYNWQNLSKNIYSSIINSVTNKNPQDFIIRDEILEKRYSRMIRKYIDLEKSSNFKNYLTLPSLSYFGNILIKLYYYIYNNSKFVRYIWPYVPNNLKIYMKSIVYFLFRK